MPELPEVETVRRGLLLAMQGAHIVAVEQRRADLRFPFPERFAARLEGQRILGIVRRAKYLLAPLDSGETLLMHLGMSGRFAIHAGSECPPLAIHDHVRLQLSNGTEVHYCDPRRFGFMLLIASEEVDRHPLIGELGVEPLGNAFHAAGLAARAHGRRAPLKAFLLDQRVIAGLGNIYVCEALHRAGLSPERAAGTLARLDGTATAGCERLVGCVRQVLQEAIDAGGSTLRDHRQTDGSLGYFQHGFRVYGREGELCPNEPCPGTIRRIVQGGRSTFYCPVCQT